MPRIGPRFFPQDLCWTRSCFEGIVKRVSLNRLVPPVFIFASVLQLTNGCLHFKISSISQLNADRDKLNTI